MENITKLNEIRLNDANPRIIRDAKFKKLVKSIKMDPEFLQKRGIVHADGVILGGNQRYMAIKEALKDNSFRSALGLQKGEIPASWVQDASDWPEEKRRRFVIIDNGSFGEWDFDLLKNGFADLQLDDFGINIPEDWTKPRELMNAGTLRKVFNEGKGAGETASDQSESGSASSPAAKFPVTFILNNAEWEAWSAIKAKFKLRDDKTAFLKLIGVENV